MKDVLRWKTQHSLLIVLVRTNGEPMQDVKGMIKLILLKKIIVAEFGNMSNITQHLTQHDGPRTNNRLDPLIRESKEENGISRGCGNTSPPNLQFETFRDAMSLEQPELQATKSSFGHIQPQPCGLIFKGVVRNVSAKIQDFRHNSKTFDTTGRLNAEGIPLELLPTILDMVCQHHPKKFEIFFIGLETKCGNIIQDQTKIFQTGIKIRLAGVCKSNMYIVCINGDMFEEPGPWNTLAPGFKKHMHNCRPQVRCCWAPLTYSAKSRDGSVATVTVYMKQGVDVPLEKQMHDITIHRQECQCSAQKVTRDLLERLCEIQKTLKPSAKWESVNASSFTLHVEYLSFQQSTSVSAVWLNPK